jgi:hypothetical protein
MTEKEAATAPQATATDTVTCCKDNNNLADIQGIAAEILCHVCTVNIQQHKNYERSNKATDFQEVA